MCLCSSTLNVLFLCIWGQVAETTVDMWTSEDNFMEVFSPSTFTGFPGMELRSSGLYGTYFTCRTIFLAPTNLSHHFFHPQFYFWDKSFTSPGLASYSLRRAKNDLEFLTDLLASTSQVLGRQIWTFNPSFVSAFEGGCFCFCAQRGKTP